MHLDDWLAIEVDPERRTLHCFNWTNEGLDGLPEQIHRTIFSEFIENIVDQNELPTALMEFCKLLDVQDKLNGPCVSKNETFSRLSRLDYFESRREEFGKLGIFSNDIDNLNVVVSSTMESILLDFAEREAQTRDEFDQFCGNKQQKLRDSVAPFLPAGRTSVNVPDSASVTHRHADAIAFASSSSSDDRIAWLTSKGALTTELNDNPSESDALAASALYYEMKCALGLGPDPGEDQESLLPRQRTFQAFLLYDVDFEEHHLPMVKQPNLFSEGTAWLFVSRPPISEGDKAIPGQTVRLSRTDCCMTPDEMLVCQQCGSPGLPEVVVPQSVVNSATLTFANVFVAIPQLMKRYRSPPRHVIETKNPFAMREAA
jgi:hypothetical protein